VRPGAADRSYGIQVAKLAGLPKEVVQRAREVLSLLERTGGGRRGVGGASLDELPLFAAARAEIAAAAPAAPSPVETALDALNPDQLTPREALEALYRLKQLKVEKP
jgi:DNA mismatch repair protein MutS